MKCNQMHVLGMETDPQRIGFYNLFTQSPSVSPRA